MAQNMTILPSAAPIPFRMIMIPFIQRLFTCADPIPVFDVLFREFCKLNPRHPDERIAQTHYTLSQQCLDFIYLGIKLVQFQPERLTDFKPFVQIFSRIACKPRVQFRDVDPILILLELYGSFHIDSCQLIIEAIASCDADNPIIFESLTRLAVSFLSIDPDCIS